jgi:hypothetical protein
MHTWQDEPLYALRPAAFALLLHYYKAQLHLLNKSMKSSKREIKSALATAAPTDKSQAEAGGSPGLFLKANLEYVRENYRKSMKLLHGWCVARFLWLACVCVCVCVCVSERDIPSMPRLFAQRS